MSTPLAHGAAPDPLGADERRVLDFERDWVGTTGAKDAAVRSQLGLSATRYYQLLHRAIEHPSALAEDPMLVRRLQRLRAARSRARASRVFRAD